MKITLYKPKNSHSYYGQVVSIKSNGSTFYRNVLDIEILDENGAVTTIGGKLDNLVQENIDLKNELDKTKKDLTEEIETTKNQLNDELKKHERAILTLINKFNDESIL